MEMMARLPLLILIFLLAGILFSYGEKVVFTDGTEEQGDLSFVDGKLTLDKGAALLELNKHKILRIEERAETYDEYRRRRDACNMQSLDDITELATWCMRNFLTPEAMSLYVKILEIDKNDRDARYTLGYIDDNNKWRREPDSEYRYREALLRCGDVKGYEELALWCANNAVTDGLRECSFYILRLDPFNSNALKWSRQFLLSDKRPLSQLPLDSSVVLSIGQKGRENAFNLFEITLGAPQGLTLLDSVVLSPCAGKVKYVSTGFDDRKTSDTAMLDRENFILIESNGMIVTVFGIGKDTPLVSAGKDVVAGTPIARVGNPMGGIPTAILRVANTDQFSLPIIIAKCVIVRDGKENEVENHQLVVGDFLKRIVR